MVGTCAAARVSAEWLVARSLIHPVTPTPPILCTEQKALNKKRKKKKQGGRACFGVINSVSSSLREDCRGRKESGVVLQQAGRLSSMLGAEPGDSPLCSSSAVLAGR